MPGTPIQIAADGMINLHPDGEVVLADEGEACCCGEDRFVRALDCCDPRDGAWFPVTAHCHDSLYPFWQPEQQRHIYDGRRCRGVPPDAIVRTRERIEIEFPGEPIIETSVIECINSCTDARCPTCPECCTWGWLPTACATSPPGPGICVHCGGSWRFEIELAAAYEQTSSYAQGVINTGGPVPGWRAPDCYDTEAPPNAYYLYGRTTLEPTSRVRGSLRASFEVSCDEQGWSVNELEYIERWLYDSWGYNVPPFGGNGPPPLDVYTRTHDSWETLANGWDHPGANALPRESQAPGGGVRPSWYCGFWPGKLPYYPMGWAAVQGYVPPDEAYPFDGCGGSWTHSEPAPGAVIHAPCVRAMVEPLVVATMQWSAAYNQFGGTASITSARRGGYLGSSFGTLRDTSSYQAMWSMTPIVPCPPGLRPCEGDPTPLPTALQMLRAMALTRSSPRV